jgi:hypothetical protein
MTNQVEQRQAGTCEVYDGRGVWVPHGLSASDIMKGARVLEEQFDVAPYVSRAMVCAVLEALSQRERR